jgi:hypothetical protein
MILVVTAAALFSPSIGDSRRKGFGGNRGSSAEQFLNKVPAFSPGFAGEFASCSSAGSGGQRSAWIDKRWLCLGKMVLPDRIELSTSPLPMECFTGMRM